MVRGLDKFREYFMDFTGSYVIIGGTACDIAIAEAGFRPRATKDIDIILIIEALSSEFVAKFWKFVEEGGYEKKEKSSIDRKYYRFTKPVNDEFPYQIEIFSRNPDLLDLKEGTHLTPIPVSEGIPSLSAILLDNDYYAYTINHSKDGGGLRIANTEALICLKSKAFLDMLKRKANGDEIPDKEIRKHKLDVLRLAALLSAEDSFILPGSIKGDLQKFTEEIRGNLPDNSIFKEMGLGTIDVEKLFDQLIKNFNLTTNEQN
jgi:hypothetical protein